MALSWMERLFNFFKPETKEDTRTEWEKWEEDVLKTNEPPKPAKPKTEFEKIIDDFNFRTDMIVMSYSKYSALSQGEKDWLDSLGKKVHYFKDDSLANISIVRAY